MDRMNVFNDNNLVHYEGELGIFDYDPEEFKVEKFNDGTECLHYCGKGNSVDLPDGCIDTRYMFCRRRLPEGFSLGEHFDTSKVTDMYGMFSQCILPEDFSLGEHFDTSNVTDMARMFENCKLPKDFTLGEHFDTSKVTDMCGMFSYCKLPEGFSLGKHFNTSSVTDMKFMFDNCKYNGIDAYDYFETESDLEIINKLREH